MPLKKLQNFFATCKILASIFLGYFTDKNELPVKAWEKEPFWNLASLHLESDHLRSFNLGGRFTTYE